MSECTTTEDVLSEPSIRPVRDHDLERLVEIYNHYVLETAITFDIEPYTPEKRRPWLESFGLTGPHRLLVAELAGRVVGYAGTTTFRPKAAYARSVEMTVYLDHECVGRGVGAALYRAILDAMRDEPSVHSAYAGITLPNEASLALHRRFGFQEIGVFREVGFKFGAYHDVVWLEKALDGEFVSKVPRR